jgi:plasmid stabilization system protein ParE
MGRGRVRKRAEAVADLLQHGEYLREVASRETARRFLTAAEETFKLLAAMPDMGKPWPFPYLDAHEVRVFPVKRFATHLVFYQPLVNPRGLDVLRVLHTAQDISRLLQGDEP